MVEVNDGHRRSAGRVLREPRLLHRTLGRLEGSGSNQPIYQQTKQPSNQVSNKVVKQPTNQPDLDLLVYGDVALRSEHFSTWFIHGFNYILRINKDIFHEDHRTMRYWNGEVCLTCWGIEC